MISGSIVFERIDRSKWKSEAGINEGYVYLFSVGDRTKIGFSNDPTTRARAVAAGIGLDINEIYVSAPHKKARETERMLHLYFSDFRMRGEWFSISSKDICDFCTEIDYCFSDCDQISLHKKDVIYYFYGYRKPFDAMFYLTLQVPKIEVLKAIKKTLIDKYETQRNAAVNLGMSEVHISRTFGSGNKPIPKKLLDIAGFRKHVTINYVSM